MRIDNLVTTIVPVHNRAQMLIEAVESVLEQDYRPVEVIVVDDGSTDETGMLADALAAMHPEVRTVHRANGGPGAARETGRLVASGEYIQYLDSDDRLLPNKFSRQVSALRSNPGCDVAYGKTQYLAGESADHQTAWKRTGEKIETMFPSFLLGRWWGTSTPLYRASTTDMVGPWLNLCNEEDWEYDCRVAARGTRLSFIDDFISVERDHTGDRLSHGGSRDPRKLSDRATAHRLILAHARDAGIEAHQPEMQHFSRAIFLLSRQCGAAGLPAEAAELFALAREASTPTRGMALDFRAYRAAATVIGWRWTGILSMQIDRLRT
jgi:glycosyltransferase involved in cell wall biosynthesis